METQTITISKEVLKKIAKMPYSSEEDFINNAERYIKAIREGRMCCVIYSVSKSGMSRNLRFIECNGEDGWYSYYNFYLLFEMLGFTPVKDGNSFRINGCGMNMVFHTNYTIIHRLYEMGFMSKEECATLSQITPSVL